MTVWTAIVPVKPWGLAKSRLELREDHRAALARAFALDVLDTLVATPVIARIVVVTTEDALVDHAQALGAMVVRDPPLMTAGLLNRSVETAREWAQFDAAEDPIVVVPADLPALTVAVVTQTLELLHPHRRSHVPDTSGQGTTLLAATRPALLRASYGPGSARRHLAGGSVAVSGADPRARRDVDDLIDLQAVVDLGVAVNTRRVVEDFALQGVGVTTELAVDAS